MTPEMYLKSSMNMCDVWCLFHLLEDITLNGLMSSRPAKGSATVSMFLVLLQTKIAEG